MAQIGYVTEVAAVKQCLVALQSKGLVQQWEIPYENIISRLTAAIFFIRLYDDSRLPELCAELEVFDGFHYQVNEDKTLSQLEWRVEFNKGFHLIN